MLFCFVLSSVFNMSLWLEKLSNHFLHCTSLTLNKLSYRILYSQLGESRTVLHCWLPKERVAILDLLFFIINELLSLKSFINFEQNVFLVTGWVSFFTEEFVLDPRTDVQNVSQRTLAIRHVGERTVNCRLKCSISLDQSSNSPSSKRKRRKRISKSSREVADETF